MSPESRNVSVDSHGSRERENVYTVSNLEMKIRHQRLPEELIFTRCHYQDSKRNERDIDVFGQNRDKDVVEGTASSKWGCAEHIARNKEK